MKKLKDLRSKYVISPIDKVSNNISLICDRHYAQTLVDELGQGNLNNPEPTYIKSTDHTAEMITKRLLKEVKKLFGLTEEDDKNELSSEYALDCKNT